MTSTYNSNTPTAYLVNLKQLLHNMVNKKGLAQLATNTRLNRAELWSIKIGYLHSLPLPHWQQLSVHQQSFYQFYRCDEES